MRVQVTLQNILEYGLDVITGNTRADLLARAEEAKTNGYEMFVTVPDVKGGDTEAPKERNIFEHYNSDLRDPDGRRHEQTSVDLTKVCSYRLNWTDDHGDVFICTQHGANSKYSVDVESHAPCLFMDGYADG